jgi:hypothetical protein
VSLNSTIPAAITQLLAYFEQVAADNPDLNITVVDGEPVNYLANNALMATIPTDVASNWVYINPAALDENYEIPCIAHVWTGNVDPSSSRATAFTMLDAVRTLLYNDKNASGALSSSGSWRIGSYSITEGVPISEDGETMAGWLCEIAFDVVVENVRLTP